jgi:hypothetical protein
VLAAAAAGCGRNDIQVYRVAKEPEAPQAQAQAQAQPATMPAGHPDISAATPGLKWKLPAGWQETAPGEMRVASFRVAGEGGKLADVSIVPLPGLAGRDLDNVNRWRGQVGLGPITEQELPKLAESLEIGGQPAQLYDQAGQNPGSGDKTRILAALTRRDGVAWFFKMTGDDALVAQQKPAFIEFLKSLTFPAASISTDLPPSHPPIGAPGMMPATTEAATPSPGPAKPQWQVPGGWQEVSGGPFLVAKFLVTGSDNAQATVNVSMSAGDGGGLSANVNRWRGQLGLTSLSDSELAQQVQSFDLAGDKATLVDMTGTDARSGQKARVIGAILPRGGQTWFYKLMGSEQLVEQQKDAFTKFVQSAKY